MAELVDALVSNTSGFTSMPVRSRLWVHKKSVDQLIDRLFLFNEERKSMKNHFCSDREQATTVLRLTLNPHCVQAFVISTSLIKCQNVYLFFRIIIKCVFFKISKLMNNTKSSPFQIGV